MWAVNFQRYYQNAAMCISVEQYFVDVIFYSWQKGDNERMRQKSESRSSRRSRLKYSFGIARIFSQVND